MEEPDPHGGERTLLGEWLGYQRHEFIRKLRGLTPERLVAWSVPPVELSVLGLVRHMTQMEHVCLSWGLGGGERALRYGDDLSSYFAEIDLADEAIAATNTLASLGAGHGRPLRATLVKMIDEYALHAGQAHMLRFAALGEMVR